jgi:hypothetical protein
MTQSGRGRGRARGRGSPMPRPRTGVRLTGRVSRRPRVRDLRRCNSPESRWCERRTRNFLKTAPRALHSRPVRARAEREWARTSPSGSGTPGRAHAGSWAVEHGLRGLQCQHRSGMWELKPPLAISPTLNCQQTKVTKSAPAASSTMTTTRSSATSRASVDTNDSPSGFGHAPGRGVRAGWAGEGVASLALAATSLKLPHRPGLECVRDPQTRLSRRRRLRG